VSRFFAELEDQRYQEIAKLPPDVVIKLHIPLEVALQRKPNHKSENIQQKAEITDKLSFAGAKVFNLDTSAPMEDVLISAKKAVWESL
jgi:thymidylate kinase